MRINKANFSENITPSVKYLSDDQLYEMHMATLEVLERTGVRVDNKDARDLLKDAGAYLKDNNIVKFPAYLVEEAIRTAPSRTVLSNRNGKRVMFCEKNQTYFGAGSDLPWTIDINTGEMRRSIKQDVINNSIMVDALENYDFMMSYAIATDVHAQLSYLHQFQAMVKNTIKPIVITARDGTDYKQILEMASLIRGGYDELRENPFIACYIEPISPLIHSEEALEKLLVSAEYGIPAIYAPGAGAGATAPSTIAGLLVQVNAEILSGLVIHQLKVKGSPFVYGAACTSMDMRTTIMPHGAPEFPLIGMILAQLSRFYELPSWSTAGNSDAVIVDQQAAIEWTNSLLMGVFSGANIVHDVGYLGTGLIGSLDSLVINNEIMGTVRYIARGIEFNKETLATDVIDNVGPGGHYLIEEHTMKYFRTEFSPNELVNREGYDNWKEKGSKSMGGKAIEKAKKILTEHKPEPLPKDITDKFQYIIKKAEDEYR
jgi:trimethylamine---corrinoid protein Co-methyltransferase